MAYDKETNNRDLVLAPNEFAYVLDETKGLVSTICGSAKLSLSNSDKIVIFNEETKRFEEAPMSEAIKKFIVIPENWYCVLKNPADKHPTPGTSNTLPELRVGKKVNIKGATAFALYPGQMAKVIKGHTLRSNQYLLAKVYDNSDLKEYEVGQLLIIKGTECSFYIPKTGIEVIPFNGEYTRQAVSLEKLEYAILLNEQGEKRYIHGPAIVFPEADETFVVNPEDGSYRFHTIELSDISGIYVKVVADYDEKLLSEEEDEEDSSESEEVVEDEEDTEEDNNVIHHYIGEELFITGETQKIYYPRPEHSIITYEGKVLHHAIAIPEGEGRYILERDTGRIKMITGPKMYLPDPRYEVVVKRKLTKKECELWYPGNKEVLKYNEVELPQIEINNDGFMISSSGNITLSGLSCCNALNDLGNGFVGQSNVAIDKNSGFNRGNTYTKPRTITIDNKYDGVVTIEVWSGYAVNVVSKNGNRKTIIGPKTYLLEYDEVLEVVEDTVYLRINNDRIFDKFTIQTKDFVDVNVTLNYNICFDLAQKDKWFSIEDYKTYIKDNERSLIKKDCKKYSIEEFYNSAADIISSIVLSGDTKTKKSTVFANGSYVSDVEILSVEINNPDVKKLFDKHQADILSKTLQLSSANKEISVTTELAKIEKEKADLTYQNEMYKLNLNSKLHQEEQKKKDEYERLVEASQKARREAEKEQETLKAAIEKIALQAAKEKTTQEFSFRKEQDKMEIDREKAKTDAIKKVVESINPALIAKLDEAIKSENMKEIAKSISPYVLAGKDESVSDVVNKLVRGTGVDLEKIISKITGTEE